MLCVAVMLSVMVVGAGAAFSDQSKIKNTEAVDACVALNIIGGYPDGSYKPEGNITRAEVCKMICVALNGGKDPNVTSAANPTFTDVRNDPNSAWAEGYIESCVAQGIVGGIGGGKFAPSQNVTGSQLAKMLLVSLGYKSENESFGGPNWDTFVNMRASQKGLYEGLETLDTSAALTRDSAAQMVWNALQAYEVEYVTTLVTENGQLTTQVTVQDKIDIASKEKITLMEDKYEADTVEDGILLSVKEDSKGTYTIKTTEGTYTKVAKDCTDLLGQKVDVMVKINDNSKVYGVYSTDDNTVALKATAGQIDTLKTVDKTIEVDGTKYNLDNLNVVYGDGYVHTDNTGKIETGSAIATALVDASDNYQANTASTVYLVSNDGDSKIDVIVIIPAQVAKVNYVGADSITLGNGIGTIDEEDFSAYEGIAKGDYVLYTPENTSTAYVDTLAKVDVVSGTVDAIKGTDAKIGGTYYQQGTGCTDTPKVNDKVNAAVYGNRYYDLDAVSEASVDDILFIVEAGKINSGVNSGVEATVLFADGTKKTIVIDEIYQPNNDEKSVAAENVAILNAASNSNSITGYQTGTNKYVYVGGLYTFDVDGDKYDITPVVNKQNDVGYDSVAMTKKATGTPAYVFTNQDGDTPRLLNTRIDDNAVIFVTKNLTKTTGADAKVISGAELKAWDNDYGTVAQILCNTKNGVNTAMVGAIVSSGESYGSELGNYGIITSAPETIKVDGSSYQSFNLWNGSEDVQTIAKTMNNAGKGDVISFETDGSEGDLPKIKEINTVSDMGAMLGAEANGSKFDVTITDTGAAADQDLYTADADTTILFISDKAGVKGGSITDYAAMESSIDDVYVQNVIYVADSDDNLDLIVIDVRGKLAMNSDLSVKSSTTATVDLEKKTIEFPNGTTVNADAVKGCFDHVLAVESLNTGNTRYTVIATDGSEYTFDVSVAPATPTP